MRLHSIAEGPDDLEAVEAESLHSLEKNAESRQVMAVSQPWIPLREHLRKTREWILESAL
jgi:hypothetical protein